jgi:hypothetical protein
MLFNKKCSTKQPDQIIREIASMSDIRPGSRVEFFYYADYEKENFHVMRSIIYDVIGKKLVIAQSSPGVLRSGIKRNIIVTYLVKQEGKTTRLGFPAKIIDLVNDYQVSSGDAVSAIIVEQEGSLKSFNIRLHFRLRVPSSCDLMLKIKGEKATLVDISVGGAMVSGTTAKGLNQHDRIKTEISFDGQAYSIDAEVLRVWSAGNESNRQDVQFAAMKFLNTAKLFESALGKAIFNLERLIISGDMANLQRL